MYRLIPAVRHGWTGYYGGVTNIPADTKAGQTPEIDPRVVFAAERTLLAWIRTGLSLMGFGFVVARFGLFLRELAAVQPGVAPPPNSPG